MTPSLKVRPMTSTHRTEPSTVRKAVTPTAKTKAPAGHDPLQSTCPQLHLLAFMKPTEDGPTF